MIVLLIDGTINDRYIENFELRTFDAIVVDFFLNCELLLDFIDNIVH